MLRAALFLLLLIGSGSVFADTLVFKNGNKMVGEITEESDDEITIDIDGMELTFPKAQIKEIRRLQDGEFEEPEFTDQPPEIDDGEDGPASTFDTPRDGTIERDRIVFRGRGSTSFLWTMHPDGSDPIRLRGGIDPEFSADGSRIAFSGQFLDGGDDVCVMDHNGHNVVRLTETEGQDRGPSWSPDGKTIAFWSERDDNKEIYVVDVDSKKATRLTNDRMDDTGPTWHPDGTRIAWSAYRDGNSDIWVMTAAGTGQRRLTDGKHSYRNPDWSPDGKGLVATAFKDKKWQVVVMDGEGKNPVWITANLKRANTPSWSSDGERIVFAGGDDEGDTSLFICKADGSELRCISENRKWMDGSPSWSPKAPPRPLMTRTMRKSSTGRIVVENRSEVGKSSVVQMWTMEADGSDPRPLFGGGSPAYAPNGRQIAYVQHHKGGDDEICVVDADGYNRTRLTDSAKDDGFPAWSPDAKRIAFVSERDGNKEIYVMNADGSGVKRLTNDDGEDTKPSFLGDRKIVYQATGGRRHGLFVIPISGGKPTRITAENESIGSPCASWDGKKIAAYRWSGRKSEILWMDADGKNLEVLNDTVRSAGSFSWSGDRKNLVLAGTPEGGKLKKVLMLDVKTRKLTVISGENIVDRGPSMCPVAP